MFAKYNLKDFILNSSSLKFTRFYIVICYTFEFIICLFIYLFKFYLFDTYF